MVGLAAGIAAASTRVPLLARAASAVEPVGTLWINAVRMTVIPLVVALVVTGVASSADLRRVGRLGGYAVPVFLAFLLAGGAFTALVAPLAIGGLAIPPEVAASLRAGAGGGAATEGIRQMPTLLQRILDIVPVNPVKAAADGAVLPLVVFALALGSAVTRLEPARRDLVVQWFQAIADAMLVVVGWVLAVAPIGIFALALGLGARMGAAAAGAILIYMATLSAVLLVFTLALYPVAALLGRSSFAAFTTAALPAQAVAFSSRSSLAALPAMIAGARDCLRLSPAITGFALPLAVSIFRVNVPIAWVVGVIFLGKLYGIPVTGAQIAGLILTSTLISFSVPGIPSSSLFLLAPVLVDLGLPAEGVGILIAVDAVPDMFKTTANVTSHLTSAAILARIDQPAAASTSPPP